MTHPSKQDNDLARRTLVKGAAWSVPVIAAAVATPLASASGEWNGEVTANCSGHYSLDLLTALLGEVGLGGVSAAVLSLVTPLLAALGLQDGAERSFTIEATETEPIPIGTVYEMTIGNPALLDLTALQDLQLVQLGVLGLVEVNANTFRFTTTQEITQGSPITIDLFPVLLDAGIADTISIQQISADADPGDDFSQVSSLVAAQINLGALVVVPAIPPFTPAITVGNTYPALNGQTLAVQLCA